MTEKTEKVNERQIDFLKPCPFCGGEAEFIQEDIAGLYAVNCKECKCRTPFHFDFGEGSEKKALKVWNRRKPLEDIVEQLEKEKGIAFVTLANTGDKELDFAYQNVVAYMDKAIEIVKGGAV